MAELKTRFGEGCVDFSGISKGDPEALEELAFCGEEVLEEYLETGTVSDSTIRRSVARGSFFPAFSAPPFMSRGWKNCWTDWSGTHRRRSTERSSGQRFTRSQGTTRETG